MTRAPRAQIEAVLANLEMALAAAAKKRDERLRSENSPIGAAGFYGQAAAFQEAINLIRTECAEILKETK